MTTATPTTDNTTACAIPVGISACLRGEEVRYNGGHSRSRLCLEQLNHVFDYQPFCPELAAGFGVPRPVMRLVDTPEHPRLTYSDDPSANLNHQLLQASSPMLARCSELDGYILMKNSPSCGMERIKIYQSNGYPHQQRGRGLFAEALIARWPQLPVEEEGRLHDARLRENFVMRVFAHHHFRHQVLSRPRYPALLEFHSSYKYLLMAHNQQQYRELGRLLADAKRQPLDELLGEYFPRFMAAIAKPASRKGHCNTLLHILGYLKRDVSGEARQQIVEVIDRYRDGEINLETPMTLLNHYIDQHGSGYIRAQRYLAPYPSALGLRNQL